MNQIDLVWPGLVVVLSVAGAIIVRLVATQGERAARDRHRRAAERAARAGGVWHGRRGPGDHARSDAPCDTRESRAEPRDRGEDA